MSWIYYDDSDGTYLGEISGTASSPPDTDRASGLACDSDSVIYQSGGDAGRVNKIDLTDDSLIQAVTSLIDEPYGMSLDSNSALFVVNEDDENIVNIINGTSSVFASETFLDDPRGMTLGPVYTVSSANNTGTNSFSASNTGSNVNNDELGFTFYFMAKNYTGSITLPSNFIILSFSNAFSKFSFCCFVTP